MAQRTEEASGGADPFYGSGFAIRPDLVESHAAAWERIASPGTWLTAERRIAVAAEVRQARQCGFCRQIKQALSPTAIKGSHESRGELGAAEIEMIHRVVNDSGRLSEKWTRSILERGVSEGEYVEIVSIVAMVMVMDTSTLALGLLDRPLPPSRRGEPTRYRPPGARRKAAWIPLVEPEDVVEADGPMYPSPKASYIYRALSLVPQSMRDYWNMANCHYLPGHLVYQFDKTMRAITRPQSELLAARVAALHQCAY